VENNRLYTLIHTIDLCNGFLNGCLGRKDQLPQWLAEGDFSSSRLYFPARAFSNIVYGRALLLRGEYLKLLGISGQFFGIASVFPSVLSNIYTFLYIGAANERISRRGEALAAVRQALELALPDRVYMPFVENCDYIKPLLEVLISEGTYRKEISRILELYTPWQQAMELINQTCFALEKPRLSERETEIAQLASEGLSNRQIGEKLFISENTVKKHLKGIFEKLGVTSRSLLWHYLEETN
jgi:LuxR family maltose regulon positive regulatory protein